MAGKVKTVYICRECGFESAKWNGKCPSCGEWNTFEEQEIVATSTKSSLAPKTPSVINLSSQIKVLSVQMMRYVIQRELGSLTACSAEDL